MPDFALAIDGTNADLTWDDADSLANNVWLSLMVKKGSFFARPSFGSLLWSMQPGKLTPDKPALAEQYAKDALQWLLDLDRVTSVVTASQQVARGVNLAVSITQANGPTITYALFVPVG
jgi:phage gp46-like protein